MRTVRFTVHGVAAPAGSKTAFVNKRTGRAIVTDASRRSRPWKTEVTAAAATVMDGAPLLEGPLELHIRFFMPRPKSHYGTGRNTATLKPSAPRWPAVRPDATKTLRAVEDSCNGVVWRDDSQIVVQHVEKLYADGHGPCAAVWVAQLQP